MGVSKGKNAHRVARNINFAVDALGRAYDNVQDGECFDQNLTYLEGQLKTAAEKVAVALALLTDYRCERDGQPPPLLAVEDVDIFAPSMISRDRRMPIE